MSRMEQAVSVVSSRWSTYKRDPLWCMQYLYFMEAMLKACDALRAYETVVHGVACGLATGAADNRWAEGFDMLVALGWIERGEGVAVWDSVIYTGVQ